MMDAFLLKVDPLDVLETIMVNDKINLRIR